MGGFLVLLIAGDPGLVDQEKRGWARGHQPDDRAHRAVEPVRGRAALRGISTPAPEFERAQDADCSASALIIWATNVIAFALWYWDVDGGGSAARRRTDRGPTRRSSGRRCTSRAT